VSKHGRQSIDNEKCGPMLNVLRLAEEKEERQKKERKKPQDKNIMACPIS